VKRRFLLIAAGTWPALTWSVRGLGQGKKPPVVVGVLTLRSPAVDELTSFKEELSARGWKTGVQVVIEEVHAGGDADRLPQLAQGLAAKKPAVIVATGSSRVAHAVAKAAPSTPIVMAFISDPVSRGLAKTLARPGGQFTGISTAGVETVVKFVELLKTAMPALKRFGLLDSTTTGSTMMDSIRRSAQQYSVEVAVARADRREEIEPALAHLAKGGIQALAIPPSPLPTEARKEILQFAAAQRWPVISGTKLWVEAGALLSYSAESESQWRRAAYYVDRILRGAKPADLPIELPTTFEMAVNLKTAKALGLTLPPEIMVRATEVIQ
jgi:putative ABC transport system substrate-binding protein